MSLFNRRRDPPPHDEERGFFIPAGYLGAWSPTGSVGVECVEDALRDAANWACVKVKAQGLASMPVDVVRYEGDRRIPVTAPKLISKPSGIVGRRVWTFQVASSMFTDGNVFGFVVDTDSVGRPTQIELVNPSTCQERKVVDGVPQVRIESKVHRLHPFGNLWHVPGEMVLAGSPFGLSPIKYGSKSTGTSLAAEEFGATAVTEGPTWLLSPKSDPGEDGVLKLKAQWQNATRGKREPVVVSELDAQKVSIDPSDAKFIDLMQFEVQQACRRHGVPPSMVYAAISGQNLTYANVTQADLQFLKHTLSYPIDLLEEALSDLLPRPRVVKYNRDAILRATPLERWQLHDLRLKNRTTSVNEVRALEDEEPIAGTDFNTPGIPAGPPPGGSM